MEIGDWRLEIGDKEWRLDIGDSRLEIAEGQQDGLEIRKGDWR